MSYRLDYSEEARSDVRRLPGNYRQRIRRLILALSERPRPIQAVLLRGSENIYRTRVGDWRVIYTVELYYQSSCLTIVVEYET